MGAELTTKVKIGSKFFKAKVLLETSEIIIRGEVRMKIPFGAMRSLLVKNGELVFFFDGKSIQILLGEKATKWLDKIKNPKSVIDKLGVKSDSKVSVINIADQKFLSELKKKTKDILIGKAVSESDFIFYEANRPKEVEKLSSLKKFLKLNGGIWVVSLKGKSATMKDVEVMAIGKKCGLVDTKVVGFSETHTALKFVIPVAKR